MASDIYKNSKLLVSKYLLKHCLWMSKRKAKNKQKKTQKENPSTKKADRDQNTTHILRQ